MASPPTPATWRSAALIDVDLDALPLAAGVAAVAEALGQEPWQLAAAGGEDFELCVCVAPGDRDAAEDAVPGLTWVGVVSAGDARVRLRDRSGERSGRGYVHR